MKKLAQPVIANGLDAIVMHLPNGLWYNENRLGKNPYICEVPIASSPCCTAGWTYFEQVNRCYMTLDDGILYWSKSQNSCLVYGGNLVSIHSDDDEFIVTAIALNYIGYNNPPYIGLYQNDNNTWAWSDGTPFDYSKWAPSFPSTLSNYAYIYVSEDTTNNGWRNYRDGSGGICQGVTFC
uniref:C-type lectin domain-containing protein n=1 Tax=Acrobeloides nanus TaxID=290746 RepID=A0A914E401_9BILA